MSEPQAAPRRRSMVTPLLVAVLIAGGWLAWTGRDPSGAVVETPAGSSFVRASVVGIGSDPGLVVVIGDFGTGSTAEYDVAAAIRRRSRQVSIDALVTTGDNLYVDDVDAAWTRPYGWLEDSGIATLATWGNHDIESTDRARLVASVFGESRYSTSRWYDVTFVFLDANRPDDLEQLDWIEQTLESLSDGQVIVVFHQAAVSCSLHGSTPGVAERWMPIFERTGVDLVLQGHDHNYQHHRRNGVDYVVSGGGGYELYAVTPCPDGSQPVAAAEEHHYLEVEQSPDGLTVSAVGADGTLLDSFEVLP